MYIYKYKYTMYISNIFIFYLEMSTFMGYHRSSSERMTEIWKEQFYSGKLHYYR